MAEQVPRRDADVERRLVELDGLLDRLEQIPGPAGELAQEAVAAGAEIYGAAFTRAVAYVSDGDGDPLAAFVDDPLLGHLLALHGIHPDPADVRIERALAEVRSQVAGGTVTLLGTGEGVAEVRVS